MRIGSSYANVTATLALVVALGGTSYAAVQITGKDIQNSTVTGKDLKDGSVTGADLKNGTVSGQDVTDGSLLATDFGAGQLPAGAQGPKGDTGAQGPKGDTGTVDTSNFYDKAASDARFLGLGAKSADADKLDGLDSSQLVHGSGQVARERFSGANGSVYRNINGFGAMAFYCQSGFVSAQFQNTTGAPLSLWSERSSTSEVIHSTLAHLEAPVIFFNASSPVTDHVTVVASNATDTVRWDAWLVGSNPGTCTFDVVETRY